MEHSSSVPPVSSARSPLSSASSARSTVFAPVLIATLSFASLSRAQEPSASAAMDNAPAQPNAQPLPAPATGQSVVEAQPSATNASQAPAFLPTAPVPSAAPVAPASDELPRPPSRRVHEGFYLRITSGPSFLTLRGHGPSRGSASITDSGPGGSLAIGGAIIPGLVLAGTIQGTAFNAEFEGGPFADATVNVNGKTRSASNKAMGGFGMVGMLVDWYPRPTGNWHAGFSSGLGVIGLTNSADDSELGGVNFSGSLFGGYDWALGRKWSLGLQLVASGGTSTKLQKDFESDSAHDSGYRLAPFSLGVQGSLLYF